MESVRGAAFPDSIDPPSTQYTSVLHPFDVHLNHFGGPTRVGPGCAPWRSLDLSRGDLCLIRLDLEQGPCPGRAVRRSTGRVSWRVMVARSSQRRQDAVRRFPLRITYATVTGSAASGQVIRSITGQGIGREVVVRSAALRLRNQRALPGFALCQLDGAGEMDPQVFRFL